MKRNSLATATLAGLMGAAGLAMTAQAVNLNPDGLGQVLIYPYYTVNANNFTAISVVNTTSRVKAVKVRFLEGANSKEVLDFNLYMSPFDVWTTAVFSTDGATGTGAGNMRTTDTSCLVPDIRNIIQPFLPFAYTGLNQDFPNGNASAPNTAFLGSLNRTREGHLEMIEMGEVRPGAGTTNLAEEATHGANGIPANCAALVASWTQGSPGAGWVNTPQAIDGPTGGLFGNGYIINTGNGTMHSYAAEAVAGFYTTGGGELHTFPGSTLPDLRQARTGGTDLAPTADSFVFVGGGAQIQQETFPSGLTNPPNAVSLVFMHDAIFNEYNTEAALAASSEWVITFPTKRFYVDDTTAPFVAIPPFTNAFRDNGSACEGFDINYYDREERTPGLTLGGPPVSPPPPDPEVVDIALCWESNVFSFNQAAVANNAGGLATQSSGIFGSRFATNLFTLTSGDPGVSSTFQNGWLRMGFDNDGPEHVLTAPSGRRYIGLPAIGFWSTNFVNNNAQPGQLANYSGSLRHRGSRLVLAPIPIP